MKCLGVVGILLAAKSKGFIPSLRPSLDALREVAGFYVGEAVYRSAIALANEPRR